ncbi:MAG: lipid A export permease/ATP-binding protein MsbA [Gammaproteobacteria bacterium]|nr:lipid A export permease/ATP-binding protein MsbA [Gammaproteobacteria bacterium]
MNKSSSPLVNDQGNESGWKLYKRLLAYVVDNKVILVIGLLGFTIFAASGPAATQWLGWTLDSINSANYEQARVLSPILCIVIAGVRGIGSFMGGYCMASLAQRVMHRLRHELNRKLVNLPAAFFDRHTSGRLVSKVTYDVQQIAGAASEAITVVFREGLTVVFYMAQMFIIDWQLALTFLAVAPMVGWIVSLASRRFRRYSTQMQDSMGEVTQITNETIKGHRVIRTFNAADTVNDRLHAASDRNRKQNMKLELTRNISTPLVQFIVAMALALLVWVAMSPDFFAGRTPGQFVIFLSAAGLLAKPIRQLTQINAVVQRGLSASSSIFSLLDEKPETDTGSISVDTIAGRIEFNQVSFAYNDKVAALHNVSFVAEPGQTIALVGKSGSGKTSLVSLIPRFYCHTGGSVLIDGVPVEDYVLQNLRQHISIVTQQVVLFNGSVADNIACGDSEVPHERIAAAARNAHAMEFIEQLEFGLDTPVGDDANLLSGGQRQRLAIARALLKDAPILILDEATSALDTESEQQIQAALGQLIQGRTTFIIAHRLSTVENADQILVLDSGRIVEAGTHSQLINNGSHYSRLHQMQFSEHDAMPAI